jgi:nucleotide-binding universal stress UspA family protein
MRIQRIVAGMDFSAPAIAGVKWVREHFAPGAELVLVHVIDLPSPPSFLRASVPRREKVEAAAREYAMDRLADLARNLGGRVRSEVRAGRPFTELVGVAEAAGADLVLVGPHGDRPRPWKPLGTTAERVVRSSPVAVLVARNVPASPPKQILVPVEEADITASVLRWARHLSSTFSAELTLMHVLTHGEYSHSEVMAEILAGEDAAAARRLRDEACAVGVRWLEELADRGIGRERLTAAVAFGRAPDAILELAADAKSDLIVLGRSGAGAVRAAVLGSTVGPVLHGASCPVLVVTESRDHVARTE